MIVEQSQITLDLGAIGVDMPYFLKSIDLWMEDVNEC